MGLLYLLTSQDRSKKLKEYGKGESHADEEVIPYETID